VREPGVTCLFGQPAACTTMAENALSEAIGQQLGPEPGVFEERNSDGCPAPASYHLRRDARRRRPAKKPFDAQVLVERRPVYSKAAAGELPILAVP